MNIFCLFGHKYPEGANRHFRGIGYNRYEWDCKRKGCKHKLSIKRKADKYGVDL